MKKCVLTLGFCLAVSTAMAQLLQTPDADKPAADNDKPVAGNRQPGAGGPANRRGLGGPADPAVAGPAAAARGPMGAGSNPMFAAIDADGDGMITKAELRKAIVQLRKLDTDQDGNISLAEASAPGGPAGAMGPVGAGGQFGDPNQMINALMQNDKNGDGKLTADELPGQMAQQMIRDGDKDGDGALSKQEISQAMQEMQNRMQNGPGGFPGGQGNFQGGPGAFQGGATGAAQRQMMGQMMQMDRNKDGVLSTSELPGMYRAGDMNNDGQIDAAEMQILMERNGDRMRGQLGRMQNGQNNAGPGGDKPDPDAKKRRPDRDE